MRKFAVTELLSSQKLEKLKHLRVSEVETNLKELYMLVTSGFSSPKMIGMNEWFRRLTLNLIVKIFAGKRFKFRVKEDDDCDEYKATGSGLVSDTVTPQGSLIIASIDGLFGIISASESLVVSLNGVLPSLLESSRTRIVVGKRFKFRVKEDDDCDEYKEAQHIIEVFKEFLYLNSSSCSPFLF
ncbi:PREDICTED: cytochrome P450 CYP82H23-like [Ipomoea nil]|uniref:cytochrome P450 CYP82H23-like n=1 Tax=Ipomoea nil TaxID=35883 RepID=UPI0009018E08|nr:PREDICTED: cytochrome P450 CYP82H23-like [Ipomoea nil]